MRCYSIIPIRVTFSMMLIIVALLLAAGCAGQAGNGKHMGNVPSTVLITSSITTPTQIGSPQVPQDGYWIKIDPISDKHVGDIFTITYYEYFRG